MEESRLSNGFFRKVQTKVSAVISRLSSDLSSLTTDAIPSKSYTEQKSRHFLNENTVVTNSDKVSNNNSIVPSHTENNSFNRSKEEWIKNEQTRTKSSFFTTNKRKEKKKKTLNKDDEGKVVYNISDCTDIHIGNTINLMPNFQGNAQRNQRTKRSTIEITPEIKDTLSNKTILTTDHIMAVTTHIGENWRSLGRRLGFSDGQLDQINIDYHPQRERVYQMLLDWIHTETEATVGLLCHHLWAVEEKYAVKELALYISKSSDAID